MMLEKDTVICIRKSDYSDTSQIAVFFCRRLGKISVILKGAKRSKSASGPVEIFSFGTAVLNVTDSERLCAVREFQPQPVFVRLRMNLTALNFSFFAAELLDLLVGPADPHPELFDAFIEFLKNVQSANEIASVLRFSILFQLTLLKSVGSMPVFGRCVNCSSPILSDASASVLRTAAVYFSSGANGLLCRDCEMAFAEKTKLSPSAVKCLADLKNLADASLQTLAEIQKLLINHFAYITGRFPKTAKRIAVHIKQI